MPSYQGELDGLCGPYAIVNAYAACAEVDADSVFELACCGLAPQRWPKVLWEGTVFSDMRRMIGNCQVSLAEASDISIKYPFWRLSPKNNSEYWTRFDKIFSDSSVICGIVGMTRPWSHWIVVSRDGKRLEFTDSDPYKPSHRKNRSTVFAGLRRKASSHWVIDRRELIVFRLKNKS